MLKFYFNFLTVDDELHCAVRVNTVEGVVKQLEEHKSSWLNEMHNQGFSEEDIKEYIKDCLICTPDTYQTACFGLGEHKGRECKIFVQSVDWDNVVSIDDL